MKFTTSIKALDPQTGELKTWCGPHVPGISFNDAEVYCQNNGLGYCKIEGVLVSEIPQNPDGSPDWEKRINYDEDLN